MQSKFTRLIPGKDMGLSYKKKISIPVDKNERISVVELWGKACPLIIKHQFELIISSPIFMLPHANHLPPMHFPSCLFNNCLGKQWLVNMLESMQGTAAVVEKNCRFRILEQNTLRWSNCASSIWVWNGSEMCWVGTLLQTAEVIAAELSSTLSFAQEQLLQNSANPAVSLQLMFRVETLHWAWKDRGEMASITDLVQY